MSVDEEIMSFRDLHGLKTAKKTKKLICKIWACAEISGHVYDFKVKGSLGEGVLEVYTPPEKSNKNYFVFLCLSYLTCKPLKHELCFDNYSSSPELIRPLVL